MKRIRFTADYQNKKVPPIIGLASNYDHRQRKEKMTDADADANADLRS